MKFTQNKYNFYIKFSLAGFGTPRKNTEGLVINHVEDSSPASFFKTPAIFYYSVTILIFFISAGFTFLAYTALLTWVYSTWKSKILNLVLIE